LKGYEFFVSLVREYLKVKDKDTAIRCAVSDCIRQGVLKEFFEEHGSEVENMLLSEWNLEDAIAVRCEEAREDGVGIGINKKRDEILGLIRKGYSMADIENFLVTNNLSQNKPKYNPIQRILNFCKSKFRLWR